MPNYIEGIENSLHLTLRENYDLEKERNQLKKELYDLRKAVWFIDREKINIDWYDVDKLMGDFHPGKADTPGKILAEKKLFDKTEPETITEDQNLEDETI